MLYTSLWLQFVQVWFWFTSLLPILYSFFSFFFSVRLLSVLRGHSFCSSPPQLILNYITFYERMSTVSDLLSWLIMVDLLRVQLICYCLFAFQTQTKTITSGISFRDSVRFDWLYAKPFLIHFTIYVDEVCFYLNQTILILYIERLFV